MAGFRVPDVKQKVCGLALLSFPDLAGIVDVEFLSAILDREQFVGGAVTVTAEPLGPHQPFLDRGSQVSAGRVRQMFNNGVSQKTMPANNPAMLFKFRKTRLRSRNHEQLSKRPFVLAKEFVSAIGLADRPAVWSDPDDAVLIDGYHDVESPGSLSCIEQVVVLIPVQIVVGLLPDATPCPRPS